jgi:hypothetical protein
MTKEFEITDLYQIGDNTYQDKLTVEIDDDGIIIHPLKVYQMTESEPILLGEENNSHTILKAAAIALADQIYTYYGLKENTP